MKLKLCCVLSAFLLAGGSPVIGQLYNAPTGGWLYIFNGDADNPGLGVDFDALDGTWSHNNGSDAWDGSVIGAGFPGGVSSIEGALRVQDPGDPRDYGMADPSNRKIYLGHDLSADGVGADALDTGLTLSFRARVPTTPPVDDLHPDGGSGITPYPAGGDGYLIHDGGKGNVGLQQANGGIVSFSLATAFDLAPGGINAAGLIMNNLNGNAITGDVDSGEAGTLNLLTLDPTVWHEFWILIGAGGSGTHQVQIFMDGSLLPVGFDVTAGNGSDYSGISYLALGAGSTGQSGAFDLDFVAVATGLHTPTLVPEPGTTAVMLLGGLVLGFKLRRKGY